VTRARLLFSVALAATAPTAAAVCGCDVGGTVAGGGADGGEAEGGGDATMQGRDGSPSFEAALPVEAGPDARLDAASDAGADGSPEAGGGGSEAGGDAGPEAGADAGPPAPGASVLQLHNHVNRDGFFVDPLLTETAAAAFHLDTTFSARFPDRVWASPLYVDRGGGHGTFFVATAGDVLHAFDETGASVWPAKSFGTPADHTGAGCGNVQPIGITGTPAIDLATGLIVFDAVTGDSTGAIATHTIYGVSIGDGSTRWSVDVSTLHDATGLAFSPQPQNQRGGVLIVNGVAYVVYGGHAGDCGVYHGWVVGAPLSGTGVRAWATSIQGAGIWAPGGAASDGESVFVATGNGFGGSATMWQGSEGIMRLDPGPSFTGQPADFFTPSNFDQLDALDDDISGCSPLVIDAPAVTPSALVMAQAKNGWLYLVDRSNLGGIASGPTTANVGAAPISTGPLSGANAWATVGGVTTVVVRPNSRQPGFACPTGTTGDLVAVRLDPTQPGKMVTAWCADSGGNGSPIVTSSDGTRDGLVWVLGAEGDGALHAFRLADGAPVVTTAALPLGPGDYARHFTTLAAVHGRIFAVADGGLYAFTAQ